MMRTWLRKLVECSHRLLTHTAGQDLIEYALLIALISTTVIVTITGLGVKVPAMYTSTAEALPGGDDSPAENPPPGHGGTPPGQGGAPPGQGTPPGQGKGK